MKICETNGGLYEKQIETCSPTYATIVAERFVTI